MAYKLLILGAASATPTSTQYTTSQLLTMREQLFLIDCGEGCQQQLRRNRAKMSRIHHIFISHLHGDHYFGLIGLISSFHLQRRTKPLHVYGPPALENIIQVQLKASKTWLSYPLEFHPTQADKVEHILDGEKVDVYSIPLVHGIASTGFKFVEKPSLRKLNVEAVEKYGVEESDRRNLQLGQDWVNSQGETIPNRALTQDPTPPLSYAFCSDTQYSEAVIPAVSGVDLLYHESTFTKRERSLAEITKHSTAGDAAQIAAQANVRTLVLGHYSSRYKTRDVHLREAREYFPEVIAGTENLCIHVDHDSIHAVQE
ncbi:MAG: ribonuclease Z [Bacteroidetes bacterium]|nr:MAG: ribonuclease Z [Bacteroidota bacterium]